jgi:hypothetical protein
MKILLAMLMMSFMMWPAQGREQYPGQYSQVDPAVRQWFRNQVSPKTKINCCSEADGAYAEEDIRAGHYWVRFTAKSYDGSSEVQSEWMEVPDDVVINDPNRNGAPVVWWHYLDFDLKIRCYAPGGKV